MCDLSPINYWFRLLLNLPKLSSNSIASPLNHQHQTRLCHWYMTYHILLSINLLTASYERQSIIQNPLIWGDLSCVVVKFQVRTKHPIRKVSASHAKQLPSPVTWMLPNKYHERFWLYQVRWLHPRNVYMSYQLLTINIQIKRYTRCDLQSHLITCVLNMFWFFMN